MKPEIRRSIESVTLVSLSVVLAGAVQGTEPTGYDSYRGRSSVTLKGTFRDFQPASAGGHPDFGKIAGDGAGRYVEILRDTLDAQSKPLFNSTGFLLESNWQDVAGNNIMPDRAYIQAAPDDVVGGIAKTEGGAVDSSGGLAAWYRDIPALNTTTPVPLTLSRSGANYVFNGSLDTITGPEDLDYTYEVETMFIHESGRDTFIEVDTDADVWVFVDGKLAIDAGAGQGGDGAAGGVLLVVSNAASLSAQDAAKKAVIESWGFNVGIIDDNASQADVDITAALFDVIYISEEVTHSGVATKYKQVPVGVVSEDKDLSDHELGFSSTMRTWTGRDIVITDNTHPITSGLPLGPMNVSTSSWNLHRSDGGLALGGVGLARLPNHSRPALMVIETGGSLYGGQPAPARRVRLPWGNHSTNFNTISESGLTIMRRSLVWASDGRLGTVASTTDMIAHWTFDDGAGKTARDEMGRNDGEVIGSASWTAGRIGGALRLNGTSQYVNVASSADLHLTGDDVTLSGWFKLDNDFDSSEAVSQIVMERYLDDNHDTSIALVGLDHMRADPARGSLVFKVELGGTSTHDYRYKWTNRTSWTAGEWYHFACILNSSDSSRNAIYINGIDDTASTDAGSTGAISWDYDADLRIGGKDSDYYNLRGDHFLEGIIDDVKIYARALTSQEIDDADADPPVPAFIPPPVASQRIYLDRINGLQNGRTYDLRVFIANRFGHPTRFNMSTNIETLRLAAPRPGYVAAD